MTTADNLSDEELAAQTQAGQTAAFSEIIGRYEKRIYRFLLGKTPNPEDAEELTQSTFATAYRKIHLFKQGFKFSGWLFTIARRLCISFYRKRKMTHVEFDQELVDDRTPSSALERSERHSVVWATARENLSEAQFTALWLRYEEDLPLREIGETMNKSESHVKVLLHRARKKLLPVFEPASGGGLAISTSAITTTPFAGS